MCQLDRAGTKSVPTLPVTDVKRRDADEPVVEALRLWLRRLSGVLDCLASGRFDVQYPDKNLHARGRSCNARNRGSIATRCVVPLCANLIWYGRSMLKAATVPRRTR